MSRLTFIIAAFILKCIMAIFQHPSFDIVFDMLFEMSQSQRTQTSVCLMSLLWKQFTSSKGHASGL